MNAYNVGQVLPPSQGPTNLNGRATKRFQKFESWNLERRFVELSIHPAPDFFPPHIQHQPQPDTQVGDDGVWSNVVGNVGQSSSVLCPDGSTVPLLQSCSVIEPPLPDMNDVQMSTHWGQTPLY